MAMTTNSIGILRAHGGAIEDIELVAQVGEGDERIRLFNLQGNDGRWIQAIETNGDPIFEGDAEFECAKGSIFAPLYVIRAELIGKIESCTSLDSLRAIAMEVPRLPGPVSAYPAAEAIEKRANRLDRRRNGWAIGYNGELEPRTSR